MKHDHWHAAKQLLDELSELPEHERAQRITQACTGDVALRREVERLLTLERESGGYFTELGEALNRGDAMPTQIGVYRIESEIGHGGMGTVYLGQRNDGQFEQSVAIKVVRRGVSDTMQDRFRDERRILAQLQHPGIAYLLDGGSLSDGRPYFVMEHVRGETITTYADRKRLDIRARLALFCEVCAAVGHAHRNLIIHRDLKPGNVMVCEDDRGQPVVKLLDFGIARIIAEGLDEPVPDGAPSDAAAPARGMARAPTELGQQAFTPRYAAPEQLRGETLTTAADIYALGILLHELLTGTHPHEHDARTAQVRDGALQDPPVAPSRRARNLSAPDAARHASTPRRLARRLRGDLDSIVLKAIRHEPEQRYASAAQLADDIGHHLRGSAVNARQDTITYRLGVFVRRHQRGLAVALAALLATGLFGMLHVQRIAHERDLARAETAKADEVSQLLVDMLQSADPANARGKEVTVREVLDGASHQIDAKLADQPDVQAKMQDILGNVYMALGDLDQAQAHLDRALQLQRGLYDPQHPFVLDTLQAMASVEMYRRHDDKAETLLRDILAKRLRQPQPSALQIAQTRNDLATAVSRQGRKDEAENLYRQAIAAADAADDPGAISARNNLAILLVGKGRFKEAEPLYRQALAQSRDLYGDVHPRTANTLINLGALLRKDHRSEEAEPVLREALALNRKLFGDEHAQVAFSLNHLANALSDLKRYDEAEPLYLEALDARRAVYQPGHPHIAASLNNLANLYRTKHEFTRAEPLYRQAIAIGHKSLPPNHTITASFYLNLGKMYLAKGDTKAAENELRETLRMRAATLPEDHWKVADAQRLLGTALLEQGKLEAAAPLLNAAHLGLKKAHGEQDPRTLDAQARLVALNGARDENA